ncbi:TolC family protein [Cyanobium sp. Alchichica 3B3-8F6]|uniref:TolC family protein n=1 Tax=Cyanobium sp. Alchichica 3B3-8F6 TaxID=2823696 RepID=UPI0020CD32C7|nr:TolC family protein [Cyanobium sp. Alchichica 3B3-8F6]MCP9881890.1 TolC family protein [Cyanobium sp. Alchichica 3B3-8F6]
MIRSIKRIAIAGFNALCIFYATAQPVTAQNSTIGEISSAKQCIALKFDGTIRDFDILASSIATNGSNIQNIFDTIASYKQLLSAQRYFLPSIAATFEGSYNYNPETGVFAGGSNSSYVNPSYLSNEPTLSINWNFFNLSQQSFIRSQDYTYKSTKYNTAAEMLQSVASGINNYISLVQSANLVRTSWMVLSSVKQQLEVITALRLAGQRSLIDEISMRQQYASYRNSYLTNLTSVESRLQVINTLTSQPVCNSPSNLREYQVSYDELAQKSLDDTLDSILNLFRSNPSYVALLQSERAAYFQGKSLMRTYLPTFSLSANASLTNETGNILGQSSSQPGRQYSNAYTNFVMLSGNWNFYDGGQNYAKAKASFATAEGFKSSARQTMQSVVETYKYSLVNDRILRQNISVAQGSIEDAVRAGKLIEIAYKAGFRTYLDMQTSAQNTFAAMNTKVTTEASFAVNYFQAQQVISYPVLPNTSQIISRFLDSASDNQLVEYTNQSNKDQ